MHISLMQISLLPLFKTFHKYLPYANFGLFISNSAIGIGLKSQTRQKSFSQTTSLLFFLHFLANYHTRAIISRGLYFFYPFFTAAAAYTADNLCTKQGNVGLKSAAYK